MKWPVMWRGTKKEGKVLQSVLHLLSFRFFLSVDPNKVPGLKDIARWV